MAPVTVGRYERDQFETGQDAPYFNGYVCTEDWIVFEAHDGVLWVYHGRDASGAVQGLPMIVRPGDSN